MRYVIVTGTDTAVGKTVATAAMAVVAARDGPVAVVKPVQTGVAEDEPGDVHEVARLSGITDVHELVRLRHPLAPETAARLAGRTLPTVSDLADQIAALEAPTVLIEGAGGVRVRLDCQGGTVLDLAARLHQTNRVEIVVVTRAGLGTLNHTELTVAAVRDGGLTVHGLVIGAWPTSPDLAAQCNWEDLPRLTGVPLLAVLPEGCGSWKPAAFRTAAPGWFGA